MGTFVYKTVSSTFSTFSHKISRFSLLFLFVVVIAAITIPVMIIIWVSGCFRHANYMDEDDQEGLMQFFDGLGI